MTAEFSHTVVGNYSTYSAVSEYFFKYAEIEKGFKYFERIPANETSFYATQTRKNMKIDHIEDVFPPSVRFHERAHHIQLLSSVFGLFLWRLYHQIYTKMGFIVQKISESDIQNSCSTPLIEWYCSNSFKRIENATR